MLAGFAGGGSMIAMFVSAFMIDVLTWRWVFALPLALVAASAVMSGLYAPNTKEASLHRFYTLGSVLSAGYRSVIEPALAGVPSELAEPASEGIGTAFGVAANAGDQGPIIIDAAKHAFVDGWIQSMWLGVGMAAVTFVYLVVRGPVRTTTMPDDASELDELVQVG